MIEWPMKKAKETATTLTKWGRYRGSRNGM
jgi:hypothetical protein